MMELFSAPARVCLAGEDLDWLGFKCCCVAIQLQTVASPVELGARHRSAYLERAWRLVADRAGVPQLGQPEVTVRSEVPPASGLASSTALVVALLKACLRHAGAEQLDPLELAELAYVVEHSVNGCGGMDQLTICHGGALLMQGMSGRLPVILSRAPWPSEFGIVLIDPGLPKSTREHIALVRAQLDGLDPGLSEYTGAVDICAERAWRGLRKRDLRELASAVNSAHEAMRDLQGMSTEVIESLRDIALDSGFAAVKLSGAGGGGCLFAVAPAGEVGEAMLRAGLAYERHRHPAAIYAVAADNGGTARAERT